MANKWSLYPWKWFPKNWFPSKETTPVHYEEFFFNISLADSIALVQIDISDNQIKFETEKGLTLEVKEIILGEIDLSKNMNFENEYYDQSDNCEIDYYFTTSIQGATK